MTTTNYTPFTVAEFIAFLQTQPQDALVEVLAGTAGTSYSPDEYNFVPFNPNFANTIDFRNNPFQFRNEAYRNRVVIEFGERA
jgi:hypothetical protein